MPSEGVPYYPPLLSTRDKALEERIWDEIPLSVWESLVDPRRAGEEKTDWDERGEDARSVRPCPNFWDPDIYKVRRQISPRTILEICEQHTLYGDLMTMWRAHAV
jgi:hypothetical protein